jgi:phage terminase large subunit-like protein
MRALFVIVPTPILHLFLGVGKAQEPVRVQTLGPETPVERFDECIVTPHEWATTAISLLHERMGDRIIAETNNGGEMVEHTLRMVDPNVPFSAVWASRGKVTRAEPISALYEQGRVHHVGAFPRLEDQMCAFTVDFNRTEMGYSPDRVDALVWALTELMIEGTNERRFLFA